MSLAPSAFTLRSQPYYMTLPWVLSLFTWPFRATWQRSSSPKRTTEDWVSTENQSPDLEDRFVISFIGNPNSNPRSKIQNPKSKEPEELPKGLQMMRHHRLKTKPSASAQTKKVARIDLECLFQNETIDIYPRPKITRRSSEYQVLKQNHRHIPETKNHM